MPLSARLAVWTSAWLAGRVGYDDVLEAVTADGRRHAVIGLRAALPVHPGVGPTSPGPDLAAAPPEQEGSEDRLGASLLAWRAAGDVVRLALPVPGDVRGLPQPRLVPEPDLAASGSAFVAAATAAGEAVYGGGLGLVPQVADPTASSASRLVTWRAFAVGAPPADTGQLSEAEHELAVAVRETATLFTAAELAGTTRRDVGDELARARRAGERLHLPAGFDPRATALVARAERLGEALELALTDDRGGAIDRTGISTRAAALRELAATVRRARMIAYNSGFDQDSGQGVGSGPSY